MEMTGSFEHMLALIIVSMTAYLVSTSRVVRPFTICCSRAALAVRRRSRRIAIWLSVGVCVAG